MKKLFQFFKAVDLALYGYVIFKAINKKFLGLISLVLTHFSEYLLVVRKLAKEKSICRVKSFILCMIFGFTWWLPIKLNLKLK